MSTADIVADRSVCHGKPRVAGTRLSVELILSKLAGDWSIEDLLRDHPQLSRDDAHACQAYAPHH